MRQGAVLILMVLCLAMLGGCAAGGSKPFAKGEGTPGPGGKTVPPIALLEVAGMPAAQLSQFKDAFATAAGKRDIAIIDSKLDNTTLSLTGRFTATPDAAGIRLAYSWTLTDPNGAVLHTISAEETAPGTAAGDPWLQITPTVLQRVAAYTAESLSSRLSQLGYATEVGGIPPPLETYARAGPNADKDIDYETLFGPGKGPPATAEVPPAAAGTAVTEAKPPEAEKATLAAVKAKKPALAVENTGLAAAEAEKPHLAAANSDVAAQNTALADAGAGKSDFADPNAGKSDKADLGGPKANKAGLAVAKVEPVDEKAAVGLARTTRPEASARRKISAVAVLPVIGAPGTGNADLTKAMRQTLSEAGWPVLTRPRDNALTILGHVKLGPKEAASQEVALAWTVKTPDGKTLGTVKQANKVPAGSLEGGFGDNALLAAQAAASGIYDLVKKYR